MNIARYAQDKFEYQDLSTLFFALHALEFSGLEVRPEPQIGEDTEIRTAIAGRAAVLDVQAKDEGAALTLERLAQHLGHPAPRKTDETLFDRLLADAHRVAVIVTSARALDDVRRYVAPLDWTGRTQASADIRQKDAKAFLQVFEAVDLDTTAYEPARKAHREALAKGLTQRDARTALQRVLVIDGLSRAELKQRCTRILAQRLRLPEFSAERVLDELLKLVRRAKLAGDDLVPELRQIIDRRRRRTFGTPGYQKRGCEDDWIVELRQSGVLLLGGPPRVGKTEAAEHVADRLQDLGYDVLRADSLDDARRLFNDDSDAARVVLLDDPLGDGWTEGEGAGAYDKLRSLVRRASPARLLLVAQNQVPLLNAANARALDAVVTEKVRWIDLSVASADLRVRVWKAKAAEGAVPASAIDRLANELSQGMDQLEVGQVVHLAFSGQLTEETNIEEMIAIADEDAMALSYRLEGDPSVCAVMAGMGIATDARTAVAVETLAFILDAEDGAAPGRSDMRGRSVTFGGGGHTPEFAAYAFTPAFSEGTRRAVEMLENRRILVRDPDGRFQFGHGFYRAAALAILRRTSDLSAERQLATVRRAIFCLEPRVARATARNLERIRRSLPDTSSDALTDVAIAGLSSIFPGARDLCWRFLVARLDFLPPNVRAGLPNWLRNTFAIELDDIFWRDGEAWLAAGDVPIDHYRMFRWVKREAVWGELQGLAGATDYSISPERASAVLIYLARTPGRLTRGGMRRLLALDEAVLRAEAARVWLASPRRRDSATVAMIFEDRHPRIAVETLIGISASWDRLTERRRRTVLAAYKAFVASPAVALPVLDMLALFDRVEHFGEKPPWTVLAEVLPPVLDQLNDKATGAEPRLDATMRSAINHLTPDQIVGIAQSWLGWLERTVDRQLRSDFAWSVVPIVFRATRDCANLRDGLWAGLVSKLNTTGAAAMFVKELVVAFAELTIEERAILSGLLSMPRRDQAWLRAIALTHAGGTAEIENWILGRVLDSTPAGIIAHTPPDQLQACLEVHLGVGPFGYLGLSNWSEEPWHEVVLTLAGDPHHALGELCLRALLQREDVDAFMAAAAAWTNKLDLIFGWLVDHHLSSAGGPILKPVWRWIFDTATPEQIEAWDGRMAELASGLLDDLFELNREFGLKLSELPKLAESLLHDRAVVESANVVSKAIDEQWGDEAKALEGLLAYGAIAPIKLWGTYDYLRDLLRERSSAEPSSWDRLWAARDKIFDIRSAIRDVCLSELPFDRGSWVGPN